MKDIEGNDINLSFSAPEAVYSILGSYVTAHQRVYVFFVTTANTANGQECNGHVTVSIKGWLRYRSSVNAINLYLCIKYWSVHFQAYHRVPQASAFEYNAFDLNTHASRRTARLPSLSYCWRWVAAGTAARP